METKINYFSAPCVILEAATRGFSDKSRVRTLLPIGIWPPADAHSQQRGFASGQGKIWRESSTHGWLPVRRDRIITYAPESNGSRNL